MKEDFYMKEKIFKKGIAKRLFSVVLALVMVVTLMPMGNIIAYAAGTTHPSDHVSFFTHTAKNGWIKEKKYGTTWPLVIYFRQA